MDARFPGDAVGYGDRRRCRYRDQADHTARPSLCKIEAALGRAAFQLEVSLVSIRTCGRLDRVLWCSLHRAPTRRPCVSPNPDSDRVLTDVHRRALFV